MNDHTKRVLTRALKFLEQFQGNLDNVGPLVRNLEGSLSAIEETLPEELLNAWQDVNSELNQMWGLIENGYKINPSVPIQTTKLRDEIINFIGSYEESDNEG